MEFQSLWTPEVVQLVSSTCTFYEKEEILDTDTILLIWGFGRLVAEQQGGSSTTRLAV